MSLTDKDFKALRELFELILDEKGVVTKEDIKHLPNKDEFYEETLKILTKQEEFEESNLLLNNRVSKHSDVLERLQDIHPSFKHI